MVSRLTEGWRVVACCLLVAAAAHGAGAAPTIGEVETQLKKFEALLEEAYRAQSIAKSDLAALAMYGGGLEPAAAELALTIAINKGHLLRMERAVASLRTVIEVLKGTPQSDNLHLAFEPREMQRNPDPPAPDYEAWHRRLKARAAEIRSQLHLRRPLLEDFGPRVDVLAEETRAVLNK